MQLSQDLFWIWTECSTSVLLPRGPVLDFIHLFYHQHAHYTTRLYCSAAHRPTTTLFITVRLPTGTLLDCILVCDTHRPTTRLYSKVLLVTCPLPDCILFFYYPNCKTVYSFVLPRVRLPDYINLLGYSQANYQTVFPKAFCFILFVYTQANY